MHKNIKEKTQFKKIRITKISHDYPKTNSILNSKNFNISENKSEYIKKKRKRTKEYFENENISGLHQKGPISNNELWKKHEKNKFITKNPLSGINWKKVKALIPTKTMAQVKSFAKNLFYKMKSYKDTNLGIYFTLNSKNNLKDMINQIKSKCPDINNMILILKKLLNKNIKIRKFKTFHKKSELFNYESEKINNLFSNQKSQYLNYIDKIVLNQQNNNKLNNNTLNHKYIFNNINIIENNVINNNFNIYVLIY